MADVNKTILLEYDLKTGKLIDENGKVIKSLKQFVDEVKKATQAQQQMGDVIGENSEVVLGSINHIKNQVSALKQQRDNTTVGSKEFENLSLKLSEAEARLKSATKATIQNSNAQENATQTTKELARLQENQARSAGLAGAAAFELGRTISDLPFGLVAISNNISQLGTLFAALVANAEGVGNAFKQLWKQIMGPAGILIAFQIVTAAVTFFAQQSNKVKKAAGETSQAFREEAAAIELVTMELAKGNLTLEERLDILERYGLINKQTKEDLKEIGLSEEQQNLILEKRNELQLKNLALEQARQAQKEGKTLAQLEIEGLRELRNLETNIEEERKRRLDELAVLVEKYGTDEATAAKTRRIINEQADQKILQNAEAIRLANAKIEAASRGVLGLKSDIFDIESDINSVISDRVEEQERLLAIEKARKDAVDELISAQIQQQESLLEDAILEEDVVKFRKHFSRLLELKKLQLSEQKKEELKGVEDKETINAIESKYRILFETINDEFKDKFKEGIEEIVNTKLILDRKDKVSFEDLINPADTASQKWAREQVNKVADAAADELQKRVKQTPALNGEGEGAFDFAKAFGMSKERLDATLELAKTAVSSISDILSAQAEKEIAIETNKTNALNDQLRARLANEQLSANERDKINQQIARNEAKLVAKENEINKKRFEQEKAARISMAIIDTFSAATSVLATTKKGAFERIAGMIAVTVAGLANVAAISKQQFIGKALPNPSLSAQGDIGDSTGPSFNVVGTSGQNQLAAAIEGLRNDPLKAYVVSSDVTTAQELERKIVEGASI